MKLLRNLCPDCYPSDEDQSPGILVCVLAEETA